LMLALTRCSPLVCGLFVACEATASGASRDEGVDR